VDYPYRGRAVLLRLRRPGVGRPRLLRPREHLLRAGADVLRSGPGPHVLCPRNLRRPGAGLLRTAQLLLQAREVLQAEVLQAEVLQDQMLQAQEVLRLVQHVLRSGPHVLRSGPHVRRPC
jgi:hypothetical protein